MSQEQGVTSSLQEMLIRLHNPAKDNVGSTETKKISSDRDKHCIVVMKARTALSSGGIAIKQCFSLP